MPALIQLQVGKLTFLLIHVPCKLVVVCVVVVVVVIVVVVVAVVVAICGVAAVVLAAVDVVEVAPFVAEPAARGVHQLPLITIIDRIWMLW